MCADECAQHEAVLCPMPTFPWDGDFLAHDLVVDRLNGLQFVLRQQAAQDDIPVTVEVVNSLQPCVSVSIRPYVRCTTLV